MTKQEFLEYCLNTYNTSPDYPFDDWFESAVLRHSDSRKCYAIVMRVSHRKFGVDSDDVIDVVNLKLPTEMFGSFGVADGVYPAYHMNKQHWISVLLPDALDDVVRFLVNVSFEATKTPKKRKKTRQIPEKPYGTRENERLFERVISPMRSALRRITLTAATSMPSIRRLTKM